TGTGISDPGRPGQFMGAHGPANTAGTASVILTGIPDSAGAVLAPGNAAVPLVASADSQSANGAGHHEGRLADDLSDAGWALASQPRTEKVYVVKPPVGRFHESLWEIAQNHLGDGRRYNEIFQLNKDRSQPDGTTLTIASLIRPGWVLVMPHDAYGPGIKLVTVEPSQRPPQTSPPPSQPPPSHSQPGSSQPSDSQPHRPAHARPDHHRTQTGGSEHRGEHSRGAPAPAVAPATPVESVPTAPAPAATAPAHAQATSDQQRPMLPFELAAAGFLAAGVLYALGRRRRLQARRRGYGRRVAKPRPDAAWAEVALRLGEDSHSAGLLDTGLRYLGGALAQADRTPPTVFAAHIGTDSVDLWVDPASHDAPAPWFAVGDGQVWRLPLAAVPVLNPGLVGSSETPYPGLVSVGTDDTGRVLVDVTSAHGLIAVTGAEDTACDVLATIAMELATSRWSEGIHLTLVGFPVNLAAMAPGRVHQVAAIDEALSDLESWAAEEPDVPAEPQYLISAVPPASAAECDRLLALARAGQAAGGAYLVAGEVEGAVWTWDVTRGGRLNARELGLDVQAQVIPAEQQSALADLFVTADDLDGEPLPDAVLSAPLADLDLETLEPLEPMPLSAPPLSMPSSVMEAPIAMDVPTGVVTEAGPAPRVSLLGAVSVEAPGEVERDKLATATELVVYLAAHPEGVHPNMLGAALWPRGVSPDERDAMVDRVRDWLGSDGIGRPHLACDTTGRVRLGSGVSVDWHVFCVLVAQAAQASSGAGSRRGAHASAAHNGQRGAPDEATLLAQALNLVNGPFLADREQGRYAWLATDGLEYDVAARVCDAAHRLWELRMAAGDPHGAMEAARSGLRLAPYDELLWRDLLEAADDTGHEDLLRGVVKEIRSWACLDGTAVAMSPETEGLMDDLLPSWRWSVA
ncbi:MAG TPA: hypothetical protein VGS19_18240, partial [Streptosporangiaceae bacterium]|nr:hypothetical protein [Streptosporangiaceae bacterium]